MEAEHTGFQRTSLQLDPGFSHRMTAVSQDRQQNLEHHLAEHQLSQDPKYYLFFLVIIHVPL